MSFLGHLALSHSILVYLGIYPFISGHLGLSWTILGYQSISGYSRLSWAILRYLGYLGISQDILSFLRLSWVISGYNELSRLSQLSLVISCYLRMSLSSTNAQLKARESKLLLFETFSYFFQISLTRFIAESCAPKKFFKKTLGSKNLWLEKKLIQNFV